MTSASCNPAWARCSKTSYNRISTTCQLMVRLSKSDSLAPALLFQNLAITDGVAIGVAATLAKNDFHASWFSVIAHGMSETVACNSL